MDSGKRFKNMNNIEFIQAGKKLTGLDYGYQKPFAFILGVSLRSVERYASGELSPSPPVQKLIEELLKNKP
jgi:DNA-binding transcriptional regulator YiaG